MAIMFELPKLALAIIATSIGRSLAAPITTVHPGNANAIVISKLNTVNSTNPVVNTTLVVVNASVPAVHTTVPLANATNSSTKTTISSTNVTVPLDNTKLPSVKVEAHVADSVDVSTQTLTAGQLPLAFVNNFAGGAINAYVTGLDVNNNLVMLQPDGTFYYPTCDSSVSTPQEITGNIAIPIGGSGSTTNINIPDYISSARIWFAEGDLQFFTVWSPATNGPSLVEPSAVNPSDPSAEVNWGFVELTNNESGGLYANISYVDFVGLVLGMQLLAGDGSTQTAQGLQPDAVATICAGLVAQALVDGQPWGELCQATSNGNALRVIAPSDYTASNPAAFSEYWNGYIDDVWAQYESETLTIDTQAAAGEIACTVQNGELTCAGDNRGYAQPSASDIFGCNSGPFAILEGDNDVHQAVVPRLCAAFDRSTVMANGGNLQPNLDSTSYYITTPTNWYSKLVHENEIYDGKGYAFSYDDVNPDGENQSGVVADANPSLLTVIIGGPSS